MSGAEETGPRMMTPETLPTADAAGVTSVRVISDLPALERELADGLHDAWRELAERDPHASLFQRQPGACPGTAVTTTNTIRTSSLSRLTRS